MEPSQSVDLTKIVSELISSVPLWFIIISVVGSLTSVMFFLSRWIVKSILEVKEEVLEIKLVLAESNIKEMRLHVDSLKEHRAKAEENFKAIWKRIETRRPS